MIALDMKTAVAGIVTIYVVCLVVLAQLWYRNRGRYAGLSFWAANWALQLAGLLLIVLRGAIPNWASMVLGNAMLGSGVLVLYLGLRRFAGSKSNPLLNWAFLLLLAVFISVHAYFALVHDNLLVRNFNTVTGTALAGSLCMWFMFWGVSPEISSISKGTGASFAVIVLLCLARLAGFALLPQPGNDFLRSGPFDTLIMLLLIGAVAFLTLNLVLMVNRRLLGDARQAEHTVTTLTGLLPICAWCKKIRDDKGYWQSVEAFVSAHSEAEFSHSVCPDCAQKLSPGAGQRQEKR